MSWRVAPADIKTIIAALETEQFIDKKRYLRAFILDKMLLQRWGKDKVRYALQQKGITKNEIELQIEEHIFEQDYQNNLLYLLEKKNNAIAHQNLTDIQRKQKLIIYLTQKGYEYSLVRKTVENFVHND
ncbi:MAG: RecX family transcriptional regulator [Chitinophagales bacterium]|nr:RecX family transcriptional regulator [Chitinophagales bacterium]